MIQISVLISIREYLSGLYDKHIRLDGYSRYYIEIIWYTYQSWWVFAILYRIYMIHISDLMDVRDNLSDLYDTYIGLDKYPRISIGIIWYIYRSWWVFVIVYRDYMINISDLMDIRDNLSDLYDTYIRLDKYPR